MTYDQNRIEGLTSEIEPENLQLSFAKIRTDQFWFKVGLIHESESFVLPNVAQVALTADE